jgi:hypothetical protein
MNNEITENKKINFQEIKLPKNFFEKIITTEMELSEGFDQAKFVSLFELYQKAIKYYTIKDKTKVEAYKSRMEGILTQKETLQNLANSKKKKDEKKNIIRIFKKRFKEQTQDIKVEEIREKVKLLLKDVIILMKYDKKNLKRNIKKEMKNQRNNWKKNLYIKRAIKSSNKSIRSVESLSKLDKSGNSLLKYGPTTDEESSEITFSKMNDNNSEYLKLLNEIDGRNTVKSDSEELYSIIGDSYEEEESNIIDEDDSEKNFNTNRIFYKSNKISVIHEIDEDEEYDKGLRYIRNNIEDIIINNHFKSHSSKYLPSLVLPPANDDNNQEKKKKNNLNLQNDAINTIDAVNKNLRIGRRKKSVFMNKIKEIEVNEEILQITSEKMKKIDKILDELDVIDSEDESNHSTKSLPEVSQKNYIEKLPSNLRQTFLEIEEKLKKYVYQLNNYYYKEIFEKFLLKLKKIYDDKYERYIKVNEDYHSNIIENEYILDNEEGLSEDDKMQIKNICECLKEEQKDQSNELLYEYNNNIRILINDFKHNFFKTNVGIQLLEEKVMLDIFKMINEVL